MVSVVRSTTTGIPTGPRACTAPTRPCGITALSEISDPDRPIDWVRADLTPPERWRLTARGMGGQILFHEIHHRAQVMAMLRQVGIPAENLDYSVLMVQRLPLA